MNDSPTARFIATHAARPSVLFDIDGTLVESNDRHAEAWHLAFAEFGYERPATFFQPLIGMGGDHILPLIAPELRDDAGPGKDIAARRGEIFKERFLAGVQPTRGARALVERLHGAGWACVIATSAKPDELDVLLQIIGIKDLIATQATADDAANSKPAPDIVKAALAKAKLAPSDAFLLGDSRYDIDSAAAANVATIALRSGGSTDRELAGAREIYDDPQDLLEHLEALLAAGRMPRD